VTLYELVTGRLPFAGLTPGDLLRKHLFEKPTSPQIFNPEVTDEFAELILRMLEKDPKKRPHDLAQFLSEFRTIRVYKGDKLEVTEN
jgi:serine/threonine protein kinase